MGLQNPVAILVSESVAQAEIGRLWRVPIRMWRRWAGQMQPQRRKHLWIARGGTEFRPGNIFHGVDQPRQPEPFALAGSPSSHLLLSPDLLNHHRFPGPVAPG